MTIFRYAILLSFGLWISWIDLRVRKIPNILLLAMSAAALIGYGFHRHQLVAALGCAFFFAIFTIPIALLRSRSLGAGDSKLIIVLALLLGRGAHMVSDLMLATIIGSIHILILYIAEKKMPRSIPFAPALVIGALLAV